MGTGDRGPAETVLRAGRYVDSGLAGEFLARLREMPGPGDGPVIIDLTATESLDWTSLGSIALAFRRTEAAGREFGIICKPGGPVRNMLAKAGADKVMDVAASADGLACRQRELPRRVGRSRPADGPVPTVSAQAKAVLRQLDESMCKSPLTVGLLYDASDPYAVRASFHVGKNESVEWVFARDLLRRGLKGPAGSGDVRICPLPRGVLGVGLVSPCAKARFELDAREVDDFVTAAYQLVPEGCERGTVAAEIDSLFLPGGVFGEKGRHA